MNKKRTPDTSAQDAVRDLSEPGKEEPGLSRLEEYRPIIGIPVPIQQGQQGPLLMADAVGAWAIERMGGRVLLIPLWPFPTHELTFQSLWPLLSSLDGLLIPSGLPGNTWYPQWQAHQNAPDPHVWPIAWEIALLQLATYSGVPLLALGDGAERWNVALGGRITSSAMEIPQPLPASPELWERHTLRVRANSTLATWIAHSTTGPDEQEPQKPWTLPFLPTLGIEKLALGLRACAQAKTTVVGFERKDSIFGLGLLARVDWTLEQTYSEQLFKAFLHACRTFALTRQSQGATWEASRETICTAVSERVQQQQPLLPLSTPHSTMLGKKRRTGPLYRKDVRRETDQEAHFPEKHYRHTRQQPSIDELRKARKLQLKVATRYHDAF